MTIAVFTLSLLGAMALGMPIAFALLVCGIALMHLLDMTDAQIIAQNISYSPWSRLYLQLGFNYVLSETKTPTSDYTAAVLNAQNNYWTLNFNSGFVLNDKTDLNLGYTYYRADNYTDNSTVGVPYGEPMTFRYLAEDGAWFDDPDADEISDAGSIIYALQPRADELRR